MRTDSRDNGLRLIDALWQRMAPLLLPQSASTGVPSAAGGEPGGDGRDLAGTAYGDAVASARSHRDLFLRGGVSTLSRMGRCATNTFFRHPVSAA
jgi:hypothetical protein